MSRPIPQSLSPLERDRLLKDLLGQGTAGALLSTVFTKPEDVGTYDSVASQVQMLRNDMYNTYIQPSMDNIVDKRMHYISSVLGLGSAGEKALRAANTFAPGVTEMILGHHGGMVAQTNVMNAANAIGATRSGFIGGMSNPEQMNINNQLGLRIAMNAYRNNFDKSGGVDVNQTHGLSLVQAAAISNQALQDNSLYESFAKKAKTIDPSLTDSEIQNFKNGTGSTDKVVEKFNEHVKKFTSEINSFTASVTKMTGDFEESIQFLQRATGGQLFKDTESASKLRKDAVKMANNLRIIAADSGISAQELYMRSGLGGDIFEASQGRTNAFANKFANKVSGTRLGMIGAAAFANWAKKNPNATKEERDAMGEAVNANVADYGQGDVSKMNVVLARLVDEGAVSQAEAEKLAASGNAEQMYNFLAKKTGGEARLNEIMSDGRNLAVWRRRHSKTIGDLDELGFGKGLERERLEKGARNKMDADFNWLSSTAGEGREDKVQKELKDLTNTAFRDKATLMAAGMNAADAAALSDRATKEGWDRDRLLAEVNKRTDVNTTKLSREAYKTVNAMAKRSDVLTDKEKESVDKSVKEAFGRDVNEEDMKKARWKVAADKQGKKNRELRRKWESAKTDEERAGILGGTVNYFNEALSGNSGYSMFATPDAQSGSANLEAVLSYGTTFKKDDERNIQKQRKIINAGKTAFSKVIQAGGTEENAWKAAQDAMMANGAKSVDTSQETRRRAIDQDMAQDAAENVMKKFFDGVEGVSDDAKKQLSTKVQAKVKKLMKENPSLSSEEAAKQALIAEVGDYQDEKGDSVRAGGMKKYIEDHGDEVSKEVEKAWMTKIQSIGLKTGARVSLTKGEEAEALEIAQQNLMTEENKKELDARSAGVKTEDAANASLGMGKLSEAIDGAVSALKNLESAAQVLASDQRDAENQNKVFLDRIGLSKSKRDAMLDKYGLGEKGTFSETLHDNGYKDLFRKAQDSGFFGAYPDLDTEDKKNKHFQEAFKRVLSKEGLDLSNDGAVLDAVKTELLGTGAEDVIKDLQKSINDKNNATEESKNYTTAAMVVAGLSAGADATAGTIGEQALAHKLKIDGIEGNVSAVLDQILTAIKELNKN